MSLPAGWIAVAAVLALLLGLWLMLAGRGMRQRRGLGGGKTVSLDRVTLTSRRLGMTGRPDRLIKADGTIIVEEWKSARTLRPSRGSDLGTSYFGQTRRCRRLFQISQLLADFRIGRSPLTETTSRGSDPCRGSDPRCGLGHGHEASPLLS